MTPHTQIDAESESPGRRQGEETRTLAIIASPGYCERVASGMEGYVPAFLARELEEDVEWRVEVVTDPLAGSNVDLADILDEVSSRCETSTSWDFAIALTDLPVRNEGKTIIARADADRNAGVISVPPLGVFRIQRHVRAALLQILQHLWRQTSEDEDAWRKIGRKVARPEHLDLGDGSDVIEYSAPGRIAHLKLLAGMVYANRPWLLFPSFKKTISAAFATGGYGLIFTTLWEIGNLYGMTRLVTFMLVAMFILTTWIIVAHNLWEPRRKNSSRYLWSLYNTTTVVTVASGVVFSYAVIFILLFFASFFYIPTGLLEDTIGTEVNTMSYVRVAWVTASVATIVGAIGAGLEDSDAVRNATFGWRQHNRWLQYSEEREDPASNEA